MIHTFRPAYQVFVDGSRDDHHSCESRLATARVQITGSGT
jgi:hypothetical protein